MDWGKILKIFKEKKFLIIMLVLGIAIMLFSGTTGKNKTEIRTPAEEVSIIEVKRLEKIIKKISGVKFCDIFVTYENQGKNRYAYDVSSGNNRQLEIKLSDHEPIVESIDNPEVRGVLVLLQGEGVDKNEIIQIIKAATGAPMHRICVKIY